MCGIAGIISSHPQRVTTQRLENMTRSLAHRGPDGEGHWKNANGNAGLGHRRLAIIDPSPAAAQPMHYAGRYTILHNGEIYNYKELKETLQQKGYSFSTQSDTEVILAAYACYGAECLQYFDGMFAFAIWDEQAQELFAARDRFGEKPFFYFFDNEQFLFASEMKALWAAGVEKQVNEKMLFNYLTIGYTQNPLNASETFFANIHKLPARHFLRYRLKENELIREIYWDVEMEQMPDLREEAPLIDEFRRKFSLSVSRRLRSDVPLGTSLSGGIDSSSVLATLYELNSARYKTFSATFPGFPRDESKYIRLMTEACQAENFQVQPSVDMLLHDFEKICYHQEEPFQSSSIAVQYRVYELARRQQVKVLLDGQGADEVLGGYFKYYHWYWQELFRTDKKLLRHELTLSGQAGVQEPWNWKNKLAALFPGFSAMYLKRSRNRMQRHHPDLTRSFVDGYGESYYDTPHLDRLNGVLYYNTFMNGLEELLRYADRNAMAHGLEIRLPFLQHELVQFLFSLPASYKIRDGHTKWLLRKCMQQKVPDEILHRTDKIGYEPPQQQWMQDARLQEYMREGMRVLVKQGVLKQSVPGKKIQPRDAHAAENYDWRYLLAGRLFL
jgi:asparagine synthase (glutamine-hydrolysing)